GGVSIKGRGGDPDAVLIEHGKDRLDPESTAVFVHELHYDPNLRSSSAAAKKADAVRRISLARRSWAFSRRRREFSSSRGSETGGVLPSPTSSRTQLRRVCSLIPNSSPTSIRAPRLEMSPSLNRSKYIRTARSRVS